MISSRDSCGPTDSTIMLGGRPLSLLQTNVAGRFELQSTAAFSPSTRPSVDSETVTVSAGGGEGEGLGTIAEVGVARVGGDGVTGAVKGDGDVIAPIVVRGVGDGGASVTVRVGDGGRGSARDMKTG